MKKIATAAAVLAAGASLCFAPIASATEDEYIEDLASAGFTGPSDTAIALGYSVCADIKGGVPEETTVDAIYENTANSVKQSDAKYIYEAAAIYLCG
ncbi:hypothetical protein BH09ACT7_BH09ACT7_51700 [soil metagenome]